MAASTWNWDAWIAVLKKTLSGRVTEWVEAAQLLTEECVRSGDTVTVDESGANNVIQGCITKDDPSGPELRVVNLKSFYLGISPGPGGPAPARVLGPGEAAQFTADTSDLAPVVYADLTEEAMWRFVVGLVARMVPGGDLVPSEGLAFIADGLQKVLSAQQISEDLDAGDSRGAAEGIYELITGDKFIETFVKLATQYGQEHGVDMMTKWTEAGISQVLMGVAAVDVIVSATDFLANYVVNNHSQVKFEWVAVGGGATGKGTPTAVKPGGGQPGGAEEAALTACRSDFNAIGLKDQGSGTFAGQVRVITWNENTWARVSDVELQELRGTDTSAWQLSAADRANGVEWQGYVGIAYIWRYRRADGQWGPWKDGSVTLLVRKVSGQWERNPNGMFGWWSLELPSGQQLPPDCLTFDLSEAEVAR